MEPGNLFRAGKDAAPAGLRAGQYHASEQKRRCECWDCSHRKADIAARESQNCEDRGDGQMPSPPTHVGPLVQVGAPAEPYEEARVVGVVRRLAAPKCPRDLALLRPTGPLPLSRPLRLVVGHLPPEPAKREEGDEADHHDGERGDDERHP
jgi:hypothetical protein